MEPGQIRLSGTTNMHDVIHIAYCIWTTGRKWLLLWLRKQLLVYSPTSDLDCTMVGGSGCVICLCHCQHTGCCIFMVFVA